MGEKEIYEFGPFRLDVGEHAFTREGRLIALKPKVFETLVLLIRNAGHLLSKQQLMASLWPDSFVDETNLNKNIWLLRRALGQGEETSSYIETIPRVGYRFVDARRIERAATDDLEATSLAGESLHRYPTEAPLVAEPHSAAVHLPETPNRLRHLSRYLAVVLALAVIAVSGFLWTRSRVASPKRPRPSLITTRRSVAVLGFQNGSGRAEDAWLATACADMVSTELALGNRLRLVPGEQVVNLRMASPWPAGETLSPASTARIGTQLGGDFLVLGSYTTVGVGERKRLRVDVRLQDARTGEILLETAETGESPDLFPLVSRLGAKLREGLGVPAAIDRDVQLLLASVPSNPAAARLYSLGLAKLWERDALAAKDLLEQVTRMEPNFALGHAMLARAWGQLGYEPNRRKEAQRALNLSAQLSPTDRLLIEGDYFSSVGEQEKTISAYRTLFELYPDRIDFGLQLASAQFAAGQDVGARETIGRLRRLPPPSSDDPAIDLVEANLVPNHGVPAVLAVVRRAKRKARERGLRLVYAQALKRECLCLLYSDHPEPGVAACRQAYDVFLEAGNRMEAGDSLRLIADRLSDQGKYAESIAEYERALAILRMLGNDGKIATVLNNMAIDFTNMGNLDRAENLYGEARSRFQKAGDEGNVATTLSNIADIAFMRGQLPRACKLYEQAIAIRSIREPSASAYAVYRLAEVFLAQGRVAEARSGAMRAIELIRPSQGSYQYLTGAITALGDARRAEGDLAGARKEYEASLGLQEKAGLMTLAAESRTALAQLELDEERPTRAEPLLRTAIAHFEKEGESPDTIGAYLLLSRALLEEGRREEARTALGHAMEAGTRSRDPALQLPAAIQSARIEGTEKRRVTAASKLRAAAAEARRLGYYAIECEARLALGALQLRSSAPGGRADLQALLQESRDRGFGLAVLQAERLLQSGRSS